MLAVGTTVWLASELMFFGGLFATYFTIRAADPVWPPAGVKLDTLQAGLFTVALVASSGTMQLAERALGRGQRSLARRWIVLTLVLGAVFIANQGYEWTHVPFSASSHAYGSLFFLMTGFHGLHVIGGLLAMLAVLLRMSGPQADPGEGPVLEVVTYYWHFVDGVWLALYATLFLLK
jgi:cytochrome c oxidase subunit III